ncbi:MAG: PaaI family thioesterase [Pseudomonadota bacterium]
MPLFFAKSRDDMPTAEDFSNRSGLEFMQDQLAGKLSGAPIAEALNFWLTDVVEGEVTFEGVPQFNGTNPMSGVHGGWYGALLDSVMGCAVMTRISKGRIYTTLEYKVNITRALKVGHLVQAKGFVDHAGRSTVVAHGEIRDPNDGRLYASGTTTCLVMDAPALR